MLFRSINSTIIYQPSKIKLYLIVGIYCVSSLSLFLVPLLFLPFVFQAYYGLVKCGAVLAVREGIPIYMFCNRKYLSRVNTLCRQIANAREDRIKSIKRMH